MGYFGGPDVSLSFGNLFFLWQKQDLHGLIEIPQRFHFCYFPQQNKETQRKTPGAQLLYLNNVAQNEVLSPERWVPDYCVKTSSM